MKIDNRNYGIDLVRIVATLSVLCVHFFLNTGYYEYVYNPDLNVKIHVLTRNFFMICVPLFMLLTGFLNKKNKYDKKFFKGLINILIIWVFYSLIEYITVNAINGTTTNLNIKDFVLALTSFSACRYSWYIEMYIGLYLISPLINNGYQSFDKKNKLYLLLIVIGIFILPSFINDIWGGIYLPNWWRNTYPIAYYICGKYIADTKPNFNKKTLFFGIIFTQIISFFITYVTPIEYYTITTFTSSIMIFLLIYNTNIKLNFSKKIISYLSNISLDIYLGSSLIDIIIYPIFNNYIDKLGVSTELTILGAPLLIIIIFILTIIYGSIRKLIINVR